MIRTYCNSDAKYLLVGSYVEKNENAKDFFSPVSYFSINLLIAPFNFPKPIEIYSEQTPDGKNLLLYYLPDLCSAKTVTDFLARTYAPTGLV